MQKATDRILRSHVWLVATLVPLLVRLLSLKTVLRLLTPPSYLRPYRGAEVDRIVTTVRRRLSSPVNMRRRYCLREGLVMFHFLCLAGKPAILQIGVYSPQIKGRRMRAHCWVTLGAACISSRPASEPLAVILRHSQQLPAWRQAASAGREVSWCVGLGGAAREENALEADRNCE